ncbi:hypothetical protein MKX07_001357 [Trichoderma sp. CBMAI-0711]|uniref:Nudix hydrolase domain-containing protein n=1 Tax=Trichoderma parareesei TaxID=858221 RepID=A0A2H3A8E7_TRIPA|nr:hypothetical protein MKX07_001357 [Trichoderma sp. CBMAI-0711]OTA08151.1 hypothetical protein A9Z42_0090940 [Trichoderma parareesei]
MAAPAVSTTLLPADKLVESAGTILFRLSTCEICILHHLKLDQYVLPKGRRNLGESRQAAALRETTEETGLPCYLLPVDLVCRVTPAIQNGDLPDEPRLFKGACEPIAMQQRRSGNVTKFIWWYVAAVSEGEPVNQHEEHNFEVQFCSYDEAVKKLTFKDDCDLVKMAIRLAEATTDHR